ncbi:outer membrane beta-barrel protein, partial [Helicobacter pylori]|uniref:outer membrane beta-barrel protein n=1 Tax=Helicobacter pylori TaxID=210 RepID=UPI00117B20FA
LQNAVSKKNNPYSPQGIETNYYLNQNTYNQIQTINQELGRNPFRKVGIVSSQTNNGAMNGIGIQVGYKQFFGQKLATVNNVYNAKLNVANFQFLFNMGVRMNLARPKKKGSDHVAQHGIELGLKIPTINTNYYSFMGAELKYRRLYSVYLNYVFAY